MLENIKNSKLVLVSEKDTIQTVVQEMVDHDSGCALVYDETGAIKGIVTERDIVRKFTLLDSADKLSKIVNTIMSRPVHAVPIEGFKEKAIELHLEKKVRHFPVYKNGKFTKDNVVGIMSVTDFFRVLLVNQKSDAKTDQIAASMGPLLLVAKKDTHMQNFSNIFSELGYETEVCTDFTAYLRDHFLEASPVIIDADYYNVQELQTLIPQIRKYPKPLVMTSSNLKLIELLNRFPRKKNQLVTMKPLDISYTHWLLSHKWN